jgi:amidase
MAYDETNLLGFAFSYEEKSRNMRAPRGTRELENDLIRAPGWVLKGGARPPRVTITANRRRDGSDRAMVKLSGSFKAGERAGLESLVVIVDARSVAVTIQYSNWKASVILTRFCSKQSRNRQDIGDCFDFE